MTIGLVAIVKDEAERIDAFLDSAMAICTVATIVDTGSTDGTQRRIWAHGPGLVERPWVDFGTNRSEALELARGTADWLLLLDADMTVTIEPGWEPDLAVDAYMVAMGNGGDFVWRLPLLVRGDLPWKSVGAVHEYTCLVNGTLGRREPTDAVTVRYPERPAPGKLEWHAELLEAELARTPGSPRATFYLAQTYRDLGRLDDARRLYIERTRMAGWEEETWCAAYQAALLTPWPARGGLLAAVWSLRPHRLEPLHALVAELNRRDAHEAAYILAGAPRTPTDDILFVDRSAWAWGLDFELAIAAWWTGHRDEAAALNTELLRRELPDDIRAAVIRNLAL